jgi:UDP-glucuronate decarboxylase
MRAAILEQDMQMITSANLPWENFAGKTILVAGANGFLPAYLIETLLYLNDTRGFKIQIIGIVRNKEKANIRFKDYQSRKDLQLTVQDISQPFTINEKIDFIIHAASQASPKYYGIDPVGTLSANVLGTHHLLELARKHKVENFLYFSSGEVYGEVKEDQIPTQEHMYGYVDPLNVRSCYAQSKKMAENMIVSYAHQFGLTVKIVRPFHTYGPGISLDDGRVYSDFLADIISERDITILGNGLAVRSFCYLSDATLGFYTVFLTGKNAQAYNIGNPQCAISIMELANKLTKLFPEKNLKVIKKERDNQANYMVSKISINCPDISKAKELGWQPRISIEEGFTKTVGSFYEHA